MKKLGCKATKVIGNGWGGSVVGIVEDELGDQVVGMVMEEYYCGGGGLMVSDDLDNYVFRSFAGRGSCILDPRYEIWY